MRCSGWSSLAILACSALALALAAPAAAHITAVLPFIAANDSATVSLSGPNERGEAMIRFDVTVPSEFRIVHAHPADGWESRVRGSTATWTEGSLAPGAEATFKLADMATEIEAGRALVYKAAWLKDEGRPFAREAAMAKLFTGELSHRVANWALQIHGGFGYMEEAAVSRLYRDQKILEIGEGTNEVQRMVIARHLGL